MSLRDLEQQLIERAREEQRRWRDIAVLLMRVKHDALWEGHAPSFTAWVESMARRADLQSSVFWRCLNAGRIYQELSGDPQLDVDPRVSAESLELADKIRRHAPKAVAQEVLERTLEGELSRAELRRVWDTYRVASGGVTARGRLPEDPEAREEALSLRAAAWEANKRKPEARADVQRAELVASFRAADWLGSFEQARCETRLGGLSGRLGALMVVRRHADAKERLELHGLWTAVARPELRDFEYKPPGGLEYVWLAVPSDLARDAASAPRAVGLLELRRDRELQVVREAQRRSVLAEPRLLLLEWLLQSAYSWPAP